MQDVYELDPVIPIYSTKALLEMGFTQKAIPNFSFD